MIRNTFCCPSEATNWGRTWFYTTASAIFYEKLAMRPRAKAALFWIDTVGSMSNALSCLRAPKVYKLSIFWGLAEKSANCWANFIFDFSNY